ncbi:hypothetical protein pb186bvf_011724 [Paramecium bursaria]
MKESRSRSRSTGIECYQSQSVKKVFLVKQANHHDPNIVLKFRQDHDIKIVSKYGSPPEPLLSSQDLDSYHSALKMCFNRAGFVKPTPIQAQAWPIALEGHDLIGVAKTGSGKTLAYLFPGLIHTFSQDQKGKPIMLVLAPTRELTIQIYEQFLKFSEGSGMKAACIYGGQEKFIQYKQLDLQPQVLIACPGRLIDFVKTGKIDLTNISFWVLDEADQMLDMGFEPQVRQINAHIRKDRQTMLFSATWPQSIQALAMEFCYEDPVKLGIGNVELTTNLDIKQKIYCIQRGQKDELLQQILRDIGNQKIIMFCATKKQCDELCFQVQKMGFQSRSLHGDKKQQERDFILAGFKDGKINILIATDVASRGLDVKDIEFVINYDLPKLIEDYVHRIGRTGRAGKTGTAISFYVADDNYKIKQPLTQLMIESNQEIPQEFR